MSVGIVGLGHNGLAHLRAHLDGDHSRVVALCDHSPERLARAAARVAARALREWRELQVPVYRARKGE